jgi:FkbM family methyltransferase
MPWMAAAFRARWRYPWLNTLFVWGAAKFKNQDGTIQKGVGKGLRFNPGQSHASFLLGTSEPEFQRLMATLLKPGMVVYDVGANVGFHAVIAARLVGLGGRVVCFEPLPSNARQIAHNARLNGFIQITVRPEALGATNGNARFLVSDRPTWGALASARSTVPKGVGEMEVKIRRLDSLISEGLLPLPNLIKIDVEGAEVDVLAGAAETIHKARPILMIELHGTNSAVSAALTDLGYDAAVLGEPGDIMDAHWNALVVAAPREHSDWIPAFHNLCCVNAGLR